MGERRQTISQTPDVEASQAEFAALESEKRKVQEETLAIAKNKQELEAAFKESAAKLDEELHIKRTAHAQALDDMEQKHRNVEAALTMISEVQGLAMTQTKKFEAERDDIKKEVAELNGSVAGSKAEVNRLVLLKHNLNESIADARTDYKDITSKITFKAAELNGLEAKLSALKNAHAEFMPQVTAEVNAHKALVEEVAGLQTTLRALEIKIEDKQKELSSVNGELMDVQKQVSGHKQSMAEREAEATTKAGNASRLELHVDKKLNHLKELEKQFTTEHLARVGYQKTE